MKTKDYNRIKNWENNGLIVDDYNKINDIWKNTTHCNKCNVELVEGNKGSNRKCMEHSHITGEFRGIVCHRCNANMLDKKKRTDNTSGHKNINYHILKEKWVYEKIMYGKRYYKTLNSKKEALCYKFYMLLKLNLTKDNELTSS